ncbi:metal-sulfur cluster assembly factor [uncultured Bifidobacterium sp.]|uniref:metal-sulfur cluster assembly factor n=1 Tax=uncultured Bifidobacterium sp. TaxID=165187 RepID=UPI002635DA22|nr:metal-sulfur cluster assembly factor [uncultured Bifidobacterium sp.]
MSTSDNSTLVPRPQQTIFDTVSAVFGDEETAGRVMNNPSLLASGQKEMRATDPVEGSAAESSFGCGDHHDDDGDHECCGQCGHDDDDDGDDNDIPLTAVDEIGRATAQDVREALHQVIDPELGIDVIDLGLVYGIEIDDKGRAIITMTLTTPACPLTDLIEDECASTLAGLVEEFRIDWTWNPQWTVDRISASGRDQLAAIGFNLDNMPRY